MLQDRLSDSTIISIERNICENADYNGNNEKFAEISQKN